MEYKVGLTVTDSKGRRLVEKSLEPFTPDIGVYALFRGVVINDEPVAVMFSLTEVQS